MTLRNNQDVLIDIYNTLSGGSMTNEDYDRNLDVLKDILETLQGGAWIVSGSLEATDDGNGNVTLRVRREENENG